MPPKSPTSFACEVRQRGLTFQSTGTCQQLWQELSRILTTYTGASLPDPDKLFNAGLEGNRWRAIDLYAGDRINERALKNLIHAALAHNLAGLKGKTRADARGTRAKVHKK